MCFHSFLCRQSICVWDEVQLALFQSALQSHVTEQFHCFEWHYQIFSTQMCYHHFFMDMYRLGLFFELTEQQTCLFPVSVSLADVCLMLSMLLRLEVDQNGWCWIIGLILNNVELYLSHFSSEGDEAALKILLLVKIPHLSFRWLLAIQIWKFWLCFKVYLWYHWSPVQTGSVSFQVAEGQETKTNFWVLVDMNVFFRYFSRSSK